MSSTPPFPCLSEFSDPRPLSPLLGRQRGWGGWRKEHNLAYAPRPPPVTLRFRKSPVEGTRGRGRLSTLPLLTHRGAHAQTSTESPRPTHALTQVHTRAHTCVFNASKTERLRAHQRETTQPHFHTHAQVHLSEVHTHSHSLKHTLDPSLAPKPSLYTLQPCWDPRLGFGVENGIEREVWWGRWGR